MLSLCHQSGRLSRRRLLSIGSLGLGGLSLSSLLAAQSAAGEAANPLTGKSVIFLFQQGGPSQLETFDPKPAAPSSVRTVTDVVSTSVPGVGFGSPMNRLAALAHKLAVVRSFQTKNSGHNIQPIVGPDSLNTNIGVHFARVAGSMRSENGMPTNTVLHPAAVCEQVPGPSARGNLASTGTYGSAFAPFIPGGGGQLQADMQLTLSHERLFDQRRELLQKLDTLRAHADLSPAIHAADALRQQAYQLLLGNAVAKALDLSNEDPGTLARYDTSEFAKKGRWDKVNRGKLGYYTAQAKSIGRLLLAARRLCEAGCGFVTIHAGYAGVWDMHADGNNLNMLDGMDAVGRSFDHAVAAFIEDVEERGLSDDILLVCTGEMGRTPRINKRGGRDHWSRLAPLLLYGGGIQGGQVIGQSDRHGGEPTTDNLTPRHLISTIMHTMFDIGQLRITRDAPRQVLELSDHDPIPVLT